MSQAPITPEEIENAKKPDSVFSQAIQSYRDIMDAGGSFSGRERNCVFLNTQDSRFATVSAVSGLDFKDDGRAIALGDWDRDGDIDVWLANRTAPTLRFMRNDTPRDHHFLAVKLQGVKCNRDAIGARVKVVLAGDKNKPLMRTLRAGEGYLSQSSKWLHFGLGDFEKIEEIRVRWPGQIEEEIFKGVDVDGFYRIVQNSGKADRVETSPSPELAPIDEVIPSEFNSRILLTGRLPMPRFTYQTMDEKEAFLPVANGKPTLINLWATWCAPCLIELKEWKTNAAEIESLGIKVLALSIDPIDQGTKGTDKARQLATKLALPFETGLANQAIVATVQHLANLNFAIRRDLPLPASILLDGDGRIAAVFRGPADVESIRVAVEALPLEKESLRQAALPFAGQWHRPSAAPIPLKVAKYLVDEGHVAEALDYVGRYETFLSPDQEFAKFLAFLADALLAKGQAANAMRLFEAALRYEPNNVVVINNYAWQLATQADRSLRNSTKAVQWARRAAALTKGNDASILDTLAAAYASSSDFASAIEVAEKAVARARATNQTGLVESISKSLQQYRALAKQR